MSVADLCTSCLIVISSVSILFMYLRYSPRISREVTRRKSKSSTVVIHQREFVVLKTTSNVKWIFKSNAAPLYHSLVTSLIEVTYDNIVHIIVYLFYSMEGSVAKLHDIVELKKKYKVSVCCNSKRR